MAKIAKPIEIDLKELVSKITINLELKRYKRFEIRLWIGKQLIKLASKIMWMKFKEVQKEETEEEKLEPRKRFDRSYRVRIGDKENSNGC